jgi:Tfp pilus assembly protein PilZ
MSDFAKPRRHPRIPLRVPVELSTIDPERDPMTGQPYYRECRELCGNLSSGGMFIASADPPGPGRRLLLRIHRPDGLPPIETVARVAWRKPDAPVGPHEPGVGVEFVRPSEAARAAIERMLDSAAGAGAPARES